MTDLFQRNRGPVFAVDSTDSTSGSNDAQGLSDQMANDSQAIADSQKSQFEKMMATEEQGAIKNGIA